MGKIPTRRVGMWLTIAILAVTLSACFQSAGDMLVPTSVDLTSIASLQAPTMTPFVTPLPPEGFLTPTSDPNEQPTEALPLPTVDQPTLEITTEPTADNQLQPAATDLPTATATLSVSDPGSPVATLPTGLDLSPSPQIEPTRLLLATPTALPTEGPCQHTVQPNEWLYSIARKYNINPADLLAANPQLGGRPDSLQPGEVLKIPNCAQQAAPTQAPPPANPTTPPIAPTIASTTSGGSGNLPPTPIRASGRTYTVASGDTLGTIARKFNTTVQAIKDLNGLSDDFLSVGQILKIPDE
jgi:membrane-bound lytic murein transglycosylase D